MSPDIVDLLKVMAITALVFAAGTVVLLCVIYLLAQYGSWLPILSAIPQVSPPAPMPLLANSRLFITLAALHVTATGLALLLTVNMIDMALLITAKAVTVVITALLGSVGGHLFYLQITDKTSLDMAPLVPTLITLAAFFTLSSLLSVQNLRRQGSIRLIIAALLTLSGPLLLILL